MGRRESCASMEFERGREAEPSMALQTKAVGMSRWRNSDEVETLIEDEEARVRRREED